MAKQSIYRPLRVTEVVIGEPGTKVAIDVREVFAGRVVDGEPTCSLRRPGVAPLYVEGTVPQVTAAWQAALRGDDLTEIEWGYEPEASCEQHVCANCGEALAFAPQADSAEGFAWHSAHSGYRCPQMPPDKRHVPVVRP
jgi:hypothetical protein